VTWQTAGILAAAAYNFCILLVTKGLTSKSFFKVDPLFDRNGCVLVLVWGLAYLSTAWSYSHTPWTMAVFALEKAFYAAHWARTVRSLKLPKGDFLSTFFFSLYGLGDAARQGHLKIAFFTGYSADVSYKFGLGDAAREDYLKSHFSLDIRRMYPINACFSLQASRALL